MLTTITKPIANISVSKKLLLGFGLVLLLTLAVTLTGFNAVTAIVDRQALLENITESNMRVLMAREQEKAYALTGSEGAQQAVAANMEAVIQLLQETEARAQDPAQKAQLQSMQSASQDYLQEFQRFVDARAQAGVARETMGRAAAEALKTFDDLELEFFNQAREMLFAGSTSGGGDPLNLAETSAALAKKMLDLRSSEFNYVMTGREDVLERWRGVLANMREVAVNLGIWLDAPEAEALDRAMAALTTYEEAFGGYQQAQQSSAAAESRMVEQARLVIDEADQAYENQKAVMADVSGDAYWALGVMSAAAIAIGLVAAILIARLIVGPLRNTVRVAQRIAEGDLSENLETDRRDEVGQLATAMQTMTESLRTLIGKISGGVTQIATAAEQLSAIAEETSAGVRSQQEETEQTATAVQQMTATVEEVARNAQEASQAAEQADVKTQEGDGVVRKVVGQIDRLKGVVEHSAAAVGKLQEESQRIGSILDVIKAVAEQTNLLALNAAIEAARAGEQGRGFAVVADEVRALASRTQNSTAEIETLIAGLQRVAGEAVTEMEGSLSLTQETVDLTGEASALLAQITSAVSTIERMNHQIAAAAEEQSTVAETINRSVTNVRDVAEKSAEATRQTASSSAELARLGGELQGIVGHFKTH